MKGNRRGVFLDRDGVLNMAVVRDGKPFPPARPEEVALVPGVGDVLRRLKAAGFFLIGVTNQPDVARGTQRREIVEAINALVMNTLPLEEMFVCYEDGKECPRRKPNPGMLLEAAGKFALNLSASFMVGDRWSDVAAGQQAGCRTVFLDFGYGEKKPDPPADFTTTSLSAAAEWIITHRFTLEERIDAVT